MSAICYDPIVGKKTELKVDDKEIGPKVEVPYLKLVDDQDLIKSGNEEESLPTLDEVKSFIDNYNAGKIDFNEKDNQLTWGRCYVACTPEKNPELVATSQSKRYHEKLREIPILGCKGLVRKIAKSFSRGKESDFDDFEQEGYFGLMKAIENYDYKRGVKFSGHAYKWIYSNMHKRTATTAKRDGQSQREAQLLKISRFLENELRERLVRYPTRGEISDRMIEYGCISSNQEYDDLLANRVYVDSIDKPFGKNEDSTLQDFVEDPNVVDSIENYSELQREEIIVDVLSTLCERDRMVIEELYFNDNDGQGIANQSEVSREAVRHWKVKALDFFKKRYLLRLNDPELFFKRYGSSTETHSALEVSVDDNKSNSTDNQESTESIDSKFKKKHEIRTEPVEIYLPQQENESNDQKDYKTSLNPISAELINKLTKEQQEALFVRYFMDDDYFCEWSGHEEVRRNPDGSIISSYFIGKLGKGGTRNLRKKTKRALQTFGNPVPSDLVKLIDDEGVLLLIAALRD
ncbi:MAG: sigma-70 family RNA polymerase sigma factor [Nanoarchaeota archaeon]|nr:sigma-70 family RNA polymerase sigma factor [Nanoarchaeota archaeon]MBU1622464.1 sigma-70 family RNA polymerase sigma factor [Nanoarchaeota archaeon]MBU1974580.1 sigma-70 family RNA polymerase sigma factor [Nanoarchaeota archaeon]